MAKLSPKEYDIVMEELQAAGMSPEAAQAEIAKQGYEAPGFGAKSLDYLMRGLDYTSGLGRGAVGGAIQELGGPDLGINFKDVIKGQAPSSSAIMEKMGVPEMGALSDIAPGAFSDTGEEWLKLQKGGPLDITGRGVAGFAGDVGLDPMTYMSLGTVPMLKKLAESGKFGKYLSKAAQPVKTVAEDVVSPLGKSIYKSGLQKLDQEAAKFGKDAVSDIALKNDLWGRTSTIQSGLDDVASQLKSGRDEILKAADRNMAEVSMKEAMAPTMARIAEIRASKDPQLQPLADALQAEVDKYLKLEAQMPQPMLRELPVGINTVDPSIGGQYVPAYTPFSQKTVEGTLPVGSGAIEQKMGGTYSPGGTYRKERFLEGELAPGSGALEPKMGGTYSPGKMSQTTELVEGSLPVSGTFKKDWLSPNNRASGIDMFKQNPELPFLENVTKTVEIPPSQYVAPNVGYSTRVVDEIPIAPSQYIAPEIPFSYKESIPGETIPELYTQAPAQTVFDQTERVFGPTTQQATGYKSSLGVNKNSYKESPVFGAATQAEKEMQAGMKTAVENAVEKASGPEAAAKLKEMNKDLGGILTTRERLEQLANQEANRAGVTQVDAASLAVAPQMTLAKNIARAANATPVRTGVGLFMNKQVPQIINMAPDAFWRQILLGDYNGQ